jgi:hypothetical protein
MTDLSKLDSSSIAPTTTKNLKAKQAKKRSEELKEQIEQIHSWVSLEVLSIRGELKERICELELQLEALRKQIKLQASPERVFEKP